MVSVYDAGGQRVATQVGGALTNVLVYDAMGQLVAEYSNEVSPNSGASYLTADHLGSPRIVTNQSGQVVSRHDYRGFGEEVSGAEGNRSTTTGYGTADGIRMQFTGHERDTESGLDYAQARYYNSRHGRFTSVDPLTASATIRNPQTFNRYSYVTNSPYKFTDPLGLFGICPGGGQGGQGGTSNISEEQTPKPTPTTPPTPPPNTNPTAGQQKPNAPRTPPPQPAGGCGQVTVEATVNQPKTVTNQTVKDSKGNTVKDATGKTVKETGVAGHIVFTVKVKGQPIADVKVTESNKVAVTKDGKAQPVNLVEGEGTSNPDGQYGDEIGHYVITDGTDATNKAIKSNLSTTTYKSVDTQTQTLTFPKGGACSATSDRVLTNDGPKSPSSKFTLTTTQPVVKP